MDFGEASDTFSGTPMACAAVCATLDVFKEEKIVRHCQKMAKLLAKGLNDLKAQFGFITHVRGEGLVYGVETVDKETANRGVLEAYLATEKKGVHFLGPLAEKVLRVSPPLTITPEELDAAFALLRKAWARI
jgi:4-aminobutyrate aminotransferase-like enzyme